MHSLRNSLGNLTSVCYRETKVNIIASCYFSPQLIAVKWIFLAQGPASGRLDRFDAIGTRTYGGPALMGDPRSNNF